MYYLLCTQVDTCVYHNYVVYICMVCILTIFSEIYHLLLWSNFKGQCGYVNFITRNVKCTYIQYLFN